MQGTEYGRIEVINKTDPWQEFKVAKPGDVGYDLYVHVQKEEQSWLDRLVSRILGIPVYVLMPVVGTRLLSTQIWLSMPNSLWLRIRARSSTMRRKMQILGGTIDSQYQGELFTHIHNFGLRPRIIRHGERYAQAVFHIAVRPVFQETFRFSRSTLRGGSGFGSTGR